MNVKDPGIDMDLLTEPEKGVISRVAFEDGWENERGEWVRFWNTGEEAGIQLDGNFTVKQLKILTRMLESLQSLPQS